MIPRAPTRRTVLAGAAGALGLGMLSACSAAERGGSAPTRMSYGSDASQFGELTRPRGTTRGVVVVIHGGFWQSGYDLSLGRPLAADLARRGFTAWNIEYRRVGNGGGVPATLDDVAAGIDRLARIDDVDTSTLITLGHSAGGHLAVWAAGRATTARWASVAVPVTHAISQAGVLDLAAGASANLGGGAVQSFLGSFPDAADADPARQLPLDVPVWCVHDTADSIVPLSQSANYVRRARAAAATAELVQTPGDHFALIDTGSEAWRKTVAILERIAPRR